jgi:hypothetical protein
MASTSHTVRPQSWKDLSQEDKIERMRGYIKGLTSAIHRDSLEIIELRRILSEHTHSQDGYPRIPIESDRYASSKNEERGPFPDPENDDDVFI